jgi:hypothetical protein
MSGVASRPAPVSLFPDRPMRPTDHGQRDGLMRLDWPEGPAPAPLRTALPSLPQPEPSP